MILTMILMIFLRPPCAAARRPTARRLYQHVYRYMSWRRGRNKSIAGAFGTRSFVKLRSAEELLAPRRPDVLQDLFDQPPWRMTQNAYWVNSARPAVYMMSTRALNFRR